MAPPIKAAAADSNLHAAVTAAIAPLEPVQALWRGKCARRELRRRRAEAREAGKLMQDKQALEVKLREVQNVLETVQNQRNELRQQYRVSARPLPLRVCVAAAADSPSP